DGRGEPDRGAGAGPGAVSLGAGFLPGPRAGLLLRRRDRGQAPPALRGGGSPGGGLLRRAGAPGPPPRGDRGGAGASRAPPGGAGRGRAPAAPRALEPGGAGVLEGARRPRAGLLRAGGGGGGALGARRRTGALPAPLAARGDRGAGRELPRALPPAAVRAMSANEPEGGPSTRAVHAGEAAGAPGGPAVNPIYQTSTFHSDPSGEGELLYTRYLNNPNHRLLERRVCALEGAEAAVVLGSGMGALVA